jgi:hypothetical protein
MGIGSKSAFAYTDTFTIVNFHKGTKSTFICSVVNTPTGELNRIHQEPTTEEDGLEIQIPVNQVDIKEFQNRAIRFFRHWEVMPIFEGVPMDIKPFEKHYEGTNWHLVKIEDQYNTPEPVLLMGDIAYEINVSALKWGTTKIEDVSAVKRIFQKGFVLKAKIGDVDVSASRESLQYTEKTIKTIIDGGLKALKEMVAQVNKQFEVIPTMFGKKLLYDKFNDYGSELYHLNFLASAFSNIGVSYRLRGDRYGYVATGTVDECGIEVATYSKSRRGERKVRLDSYNHYEIRCSEKYAYVLNDVNEERPANKVAVLIERANNHLNKQFAIVYVITIKNKTKYDAWKLKNQFDAPLTNISSLPVVKTTELYPRNTTAQSYTYSPKNNTKMLVFDWNKSGWTNSEYFKIEDISKVKTNPIPYVVIERYQIRQMKSAGINDLVLPNDFITTYRNLLSALGEKDPVLVCVKPSVEDDVKEDKKYIHFNDYIFSLLKKNESLWKELCFEHFISNYRQGDRYADVGFVDDNLLKTLFKASNRFNKNTEAYKLFQNHSIGSNKTDGFKTILSKWNHIRHILGTKAIHGDAEKKQETFENGLKKLMKNHPMLGLIDGYKRSNNETVKYIIQYINLTDASVKNAVTV